MRHAMNRPTADPRHDDPRWTLELSTATEALHRRPLDVHVSAGEELLLTPANEDHRRYFIEVALETFEDLQILGLVPRSIPEARIREAIAEDDRATYERALQSPTAEQGTPCGCDDSARAGPVNSSLSLR